MTVNESSFGSLEMGFSHVRYKHMLIICLLLSLVYVWISWYFPPKSMLQHTGLSVHKHSHQSSSSGDQSSVIYRPVRRDSCGLDLDTSLLSDTSCQLKLPLKASCDVTQKLFNGKLRTCQVKRKAKHCVISDQKVHCNITQCYPSAVDLGCLNIVNGLTEWHQYQTSKALSEAITGLLQTGQHSHYVFIRCAGQKLTQLLILPEVPTTFKSSAASNDHINIHILFIDSVSYYHFHRSLPKTLSALRRINSSQTSVFSYPLYQSIKSRTFENLQALFGGKADIDSQAFGIQAMPDSRLKLEVILKPLKDKGYHNLFMEDLCWNWEWGLSKDLLVHNKHLNRTQYWRKMVNAFDTASIDSYGISPSSCEVLADTGHPDPFHGVPMICYNGQYHHSYILDYLDSYQEARAIEGTPYSSVYTSNVPHDEWGTRVQTLDSDLADHLTTVSKQPNTLTIILSDHGNTYGDFPQHYRQGRDEAYHPALYMIIPEKVRLSLGRQIMSDLETNQARLVTVMDLHFLLKHIAAPSSERKGLISPLPKSRECSDLPLFHPYICICAEKGDRSLTDTELGLLAELASGSLTNNLIEDGGGIGKAKCRVLLPVNYSHPISTPNKDGSYSVSMDINYPSPSGEFLETILVTVQYKPVSSGPNNAKLLAYERRSGFGGYRVCGDGPSSESLCICESGKKYGLNIAENWLRNVRTDNPMISSHESHQINKCVYIIQYEFNIKGSSLYSINVCTDISYKLNVNIIYLPEGFSYSALPSAGWVLPPGGIKFAFMLYFSSEQHNVSLNSFFEFSVSIV